MQSETERRRSWWSVFKLWNNSHPSVSERVGAMRDELSKWDAYRQAHSALGGATTGQTLEGGQTP